MSFVADSLSPSKPIAGLDAFTGVTGAKAAENAAQLQAQSGQNALDYQKQSDAQARADLSPFVNFSTRSNSQNTQPGQVAQTQANFDPAAYLAANPDVAASPYYSKNPYLHYIQNGQNEGRAFTAIPGATTVGGNYSADSPIGQLSNILTPQGQTDYLRSNPLFQIAMDKLDRISNNTFLGRGKVGDATGQLVNNAFIAGQPLLQQQTGNLFDSVRLGQNSAAGQATGTLSSASNVNNLTTGIGNALAAGQVGAANAQAQGAKNVVSAGTTIASLFG